MPEYEELRRLRGEVSSLRDLLVNLQATHHQQSQAIAAYLGTVGEAALVDQDEGIFRGRTASGSLTSGVSRLGGQKAAAFGSSFRRPSPLPASLAPIAPATPTVPKDVHHSPEFPGNPPYFPPPPAVPTASEKASELAGQEELIQRAITLRRRPVPTRITVPTSTEQNSLKPESNNLKEPVTPTTPLASFAPQKPAVPRAGFANFASFAGPKAAVTIKAPENENSGTLEAKAPSPGRRASKSRSRQGSRSRPASPITDSETQGVDAEVQMWIRWGGGQFTEESLRDELAETRRRVFQSGIVSQEEVFSELVMSNYFSQVPDNYTPGEDEYYELSRYMNLAGDNNPQESVMVRDYYSMKCDKVINYTIENDKDLWSYLARARCEGGVKYSDATAEMLESYHKVDGCVGTIKGNGNGEFPAYGREIVVQELTPNIALLLMGISHNMTYQNSEPERIMDSVLTNAVVGEPVTRCSYDREFKHWAFSFSASFFKLEEFVEGSTDPLGLLAYPPKGFGSALRGPFYPTKKDCPMIYQNTLSIAFDCLHAEEGSYWTMWSFGFYYDEKAYEVSKDTRVEAMPQYTCPEEVLLDKLARLIDYVVDDGIANVLKIMDTYLNIPVEALFSKELSDKLLFDDVRFTRTKTYHWAMQWLNKMAHCMKTLVAELDEFERSKLQYFRKTAIAHRKRAGIPAPDVALTNEATYHRKADRARVVLRRVEHKQAEVKDLRDALVNASGVLESRAAVSQAETVHVLTILMIIYLPVTTVIGVFGMEFLPASSQKLTIFLISLGSVVLGTSLLGLSLASILTFLDHIGRKWGSKLQQSMKNLGPSWKSRSYKLQEFTEAEKIVEREEKIPVGWYYIWFTLMWFWVIFPSKEVRQIGGIRTLSNIVSDTLHARGDRSNVEIDWLWDLAAVPFRIALLPIHILTLLFAYSLLLIFGTGIVGRQRGEVQKVSKQARAKKSDAVVTEKGNETMDSLEKKNTVHISVVQASTTERQTRKWTDHFIDPFRILNEFSAAGSYRPGTTKVEVVVGDVDHKDDLPLTEEELKERTAFYASIAEVVKLAKEARPDDDDDDEEEEEGADDNECDDGEEVTGGNAAPLAETNRPQTAGDIVVTMHTTPRVDEGNGGRFSTGFQYPSNGDISDPPDAPAGGIFSTGFKYPSNGDISDPMDSPKGGRYTTGFQYPSNDHTSDPSGEPSGGGRFSTGFSYPSNGDTSDPPDLPTGGRFTTGFQYPSNGDTCDPPDFPASGGRFEIGFHYPSSGDTSDPPDIPIRGPFTTGFQYPSNGDTSDPPDLSPNLPLTSGFAYPSNGATSDPPPTSPPFASRFNSRFVFPDNGATSDPPEPPRTPPRFTSGFRYPSSGATSDPPASASGDYDVEGGRSGSNSSDVIHGSPNTPGVLSVIRTRPTWERDLEKGV